MGMALLALPEIKAYFQELQGMLIFKEKDRL
jgi:hypothetical protein